MTSHKWQTYWSTWVRTFFLSHQKQLTTNRTQIKRVIAIHIVRFIIFFYLMSIWYEFFFSTFESFGLLIFLFYYHWIYQQNYYKYVETKKNCSKNISNWLVFHDSFMFEKKTCCMKFCIIFGTWNTSHVFLIMHSYNADCVLTMTFFWMLNANLLYKYTDCFFCCHKRIGQSWP